MIEKIQHATASSPEGAKGLVKGILACAFQNMAFMLPTGLLYLLVKDLLAGSTSGRSTFYLLGCVACFALILLTTWFQYNGTYFTTYKESGTRRLTLAERLRKLPLSFFGKRDLADLTSTIMAYWHQGCVSFRRRAAAHRHCPCHAEKFPHPDPGRGHRLCRPGQ